MVILHCGERIFIGDWETCKEGRTLNQPMQLPKDLREMTECQVQSTVSYLSNRSLKELRRWQKAMFMQMERADTEQQLVNLQEMDRHLAAAIHVKVF